MGRGGEGRGLECFVWNQNPLVGQAVTEEVWFAGAPHGYTMHLDFEPKHGFPCVTLCECHAQFCVGSTCRALLWRMMVILPFNAGCWNTLHLVSW